MLVARIQVGPAARSRLPASSCNLLAKRTDHGVALIYKICASPDWDAAVRAGRYQGSADDARDGFIHLSTREQLAGTAAKHFRGKTDLVLVAIDAARLGDGLKWEPSRGGVLFPHLYAPLDVSTARFVRALRLAADGVPVIPEDLP